MSHPGSKPGIAALCTGAATLLQGAIAALLFSADLDRVYFLGRPIRWVCGFRARFGLPCPTCGMTRSIVLSLHGEIARAWRLAPAGPVVVFGLLAFAIALLALAFTQLRRVPKWEAVTTVWFRRSALLYSVVTVLVWAGGWTVRFRAALH